MIRGFRELGYRGFASVGGGRDRRMLVGEMIDQAHTGTYSVIHYGIAADGGEPVRNERHRSTSGERRFPAAGRRTASEARRSRVEATRWI